LPVAQLPVGFILLDAIGRLDALHQVITATRDDIEFIGGQPSPAFPDKIPPVRPVASNAIPLQGRLAGDFR
jgi:hypothetical protein